MFQNFLNNLTRNAHKTKEHLVKNLNKDSLKQKYFKLLKDPKIQKITNVSPDEYKQQMNFIKQSYNNKKKEFERELNKLKKKKPEEILRNTFTNKNYLNRINLEKTKNNAKEKLDIVLRKVRNIYENRSKKLNKSAFEKKEKCNDYKDEDKEKFSEQRSDKNSEKLNTNFNYFELLKEKAFSLKNYANDKLKNYTYRMIFYFLSFVFMVKFLKYLYGKLLGPKDLKDEKYNQIIQQLDLLQRQNQELRLMIHSLLESKNR